MEVPQVRSSGVYGIYNKVSDKWYVGSAAKSIYGRVHLHLVGLRAGDHHNVHLQASWNKYGPDAFTCEVLTSCLPEKCIEMEQFWMNELLVTDSRYPVADQKPTPVVVMPRLTVVETLYYHAGGASDPVGVAASFDRPLNSGEQLYVRDTVTKGKPAPLDTGWVGENVAHVLLQNLEKKDGPGLLVYIGNGREVVDPVVLPGIVVPPGESARFTPFRSSRVFIAGDAHGATKYRLTVVPK